MFDMVKSTFKLYEPPRYYLTKQTIVCLNCIQIPKKETFKTSRTTEVTDTLHTVKIKISHPEGEIMSIYKKLCAAAVFSFAAVTSIASAETWRFGLEEIEGSVQAKYAEARSEERRVGKECRSGW